MDTDMTVAWDQLAQTVDDTDAGQAAFTLLSLTSATEEPTFKAAALGYTAIVEASVHTQLAVLALVKLLIRMAEQANWFAFPALLVAELNVTMMALPALLNAAKASWGTAGTMMPAASVACSVGLAVGFTLGSFVGCAEGATLGGTLGFTVGSNAGRVLGDRLGL